jgi:DNA topoisomerase IB
MTRERALATGFRLLDLTGVRIGSEAYAQTYGTFGIATLRREHVSTGGGRVRLRFPGKGGRIHDIAIVDADLLDSVRVLLARRSGGPELLAWRSGRSWVDVRSVDLNDYVRDVTGCANLTAKDFRTWQAAVRALAALSETDAPGPRRPTVSRAMRAVSDHLGNTPTVARSSYVPPDLVAAYLDGEVLPTVPDPVDEESLGWEAWEQAALEFLTR